MPLNNSSMEEFGYLQKPENSKRFKKVLQMLQLLLVLTLAAMAVMAIQFYTSVK